MFVSQVSDKTDNDGPSGRAEEKMIHVMKSETPGSKYSVHRPSQLFDCQREFPQTDDRLAGATWGMD